MFNLFGTSRFVALTKVVVQKLSIYKIKSIYLCVVRSQQMPM